MKKGLLLLTTIVMGLLVVACSNDTTTDAYGETGSKVLTIGVDDAYKPMEYRNENNELVGFDIDFAGLLAEEMDVEIEWIPTAWDGIFAGLEAEKYDCIISSTSITPDRLESYEMSVPYLANGQVIVVPTDDAAVNSIEDLEGKKVGVQIETTADTAAKKQQEQTDFELRQYDDIGQTFAELGTGRIDCIVVDYAVAIEYVSLSEGKLKITTTQLTNEPIGVTMKKGNTELLEQVNTAIRALQADGSLVPLSEEWLGGDYVTDIDEELR